MMTRQLLSAENNCRALNYILAQERFTMTQHTKPVKTPDNWDADGRSKGKQSGPVRPTPDASAPKKK